MKHIFYFLIITLTSVTLGAKPKLINFKNYTNNAAGLQSAINAAGEGGSVIIPANRTCVLTANVNVGLNRLSIVGENSTGSQLQFKGGRIIFKNGSGGAIYSMRNLKINDHSNTQNKTLIEFISKSNGGSKLSLDNINMNRASGGKAKAIVGVQNFNEVKINQVDFDGRNGSGIAFNFSKNGRSLLFTNANIDKFKTGINLTHSPDFSTISGVSMKSTVVGINMVSSAKSPVLQVYAADFLGCASPIKISESAKIIIAKSYFGKRSSSVYVNDIDLNNTGIEGVIYDNYLDRGVHCKKVRKLTITGNVFKSGFQVAGRNANSNFGYIVVENRKEVKAEGNLYVGNGNIDSAILHTSGNKVLMDKLEKF